MPDSEEEAAGWAELAEEIRADILEPGVKDGVMRQRYDTEALDASVLLAPLVRFLPPDHEVMRKTVLAVADGLAEHGLVLRYRVDETEDGLHGEEGTFAICSFWLVSASGDRRDRKGAGPVREAARDRGPAAPLRGGDRAPQPRPSR